MSNTFYYKLSPIQAPSSIPAKISFFPYLIYKTTDISSCPDSDQPQISAPQAEKNPIKTTNLPLSTQQTEHKLNQDQLLSIRC